MNLPKLESFKRRGWIQKIVLTAQIFKTWSRPFVYFRERENRKFKIALWHLWKLKTPGWQLGTGSSSVCGLCSWQAWKIAFRWLTGALIHCRSPPQIPSNNIFLFWNLSPICTWVWFDIPMECCVRGSLESKAHPCVSAVIPRRSSILGGDGWLREPCICKGLMAQCLPRQTQRWSEFYVVGQGSKKEKVHGMRRKRMKDLQCGVASLLPCPCWCEL